MSRTNIEYGLRGAFKMDTYDGKGQFVETTDWFDNFITQTGLIYPTIYSFANCFRYLTIGKHAGNNYGGFGGAVTDFTDGNGNLHVLNPTTGCNDPFYNFTDSNSQSQRGAWMGWEGYETGTDPVQNSSCRTIVTPNGIRFYRAWQVPSGGEGVTANHTGGLINIQELSVSPGDRHDTTGCFAFSRVVRNLPLKNGYRAVISYQLQVNCTNYTLSNFTGEIYDTNWRGGTFNTGLADVTNDIDMLSQWAKLSGMYRQVWAGLSCVDAYGAAFIPKYGNGMEPSLQDLSKYFIYLSPDNSQFDVNNTGGGTNSSSTTAWSSDGVMKPITQNLTLTNKRSDFASPQAVSTLIYGPEQLLDLPTAVTPFNIRLGSTSAPLKAPNLKNYTVAPSFVDADFNYQGWTENGPYTASARAETISYATPGGSGMSFTRANDTQEKAVFSTRMYKMPMDLTRVGNAVSTGRRKTITRKALFTPASSQGYNSRFGSMVFAYRHNNDTLGDYTYYPMLDSLFYDNSGQAKLQHYRLISGIYLTERGTGVAGCTVTIRPAGTNINRHVSRRTFQGPVTGYVQVPGWVTNGDDSLRGNMISGVVKTGWMGTGTSGNLTWYAGDLPFDTTTGCSGWGAVIGFMGDDYNDGSLYYDMGIAEHPSGLITEPTGGNPSLLYWPYVRASEPLHVHFENVMFYSGYGKLWEAGLSTDAVLRASGFCKPTGYIYHFDSIGGEGYRLLPNFGIANTDMTNAGSLYYNSSDNTTNMGGALPGLSLDNGMEVYLDIGWSSDCRGCAVGTCSEPTTMQPNT